MRPHVLGLILLATTSGFAGHALAMRFPLIAVTFAVFAAIAFTLLLGAFGEEG